MLSSLTTQHPRPRVTWRGSKRSDDFSSNSPCRQTGPSTRCQMRPPAPPPSRRTFTTRASSSPQGESAAVGRPSAAPSAEHRPIQRPPFVLHTHDDGLNLRQASVHVVGLIEIQALPLLSDHPIYLLKSSV